jgi:O-antigen/teichoic acid export membrane protein
LQRQLTLNLLLAVFATVRAVGALLALILVAPTIEVFLWWQVAVSAAQSVAFAGATWRALPAGRRPQFSVQELRKTVRFAAGITGVTVLSFLLTQSDRIVLSKVLSLDAFGVYAFAATLALAILRLVYPIVGAVYPRYSQLVAAGDGAHLTEFYHRTCQVMSAVLLPVAATVVAFAGDLLRLWTGDAELARVSAPILAVLVAGSALNGLMNLPYAMQLAHGWTALSFWINLVSVCVLVPATWIMGSAYGGVGAALVWLTLNLGYVLVGIPLMHRRLLREEMTRWYWADLGRPLMASATAVLLWKVAMPSVPPGILGWTVLAAVLATCMAACVAATPVTRNVIFAWWRRSRRHA